MSSKQQSVQSDVTKELPKLVKIADKIELEVRKDDELNAIVAVLKIADFDTDGLYKLSDHIKSCCGEEFAVTRLDGSVRLAKVLLIQASEASQQLLNQLINALVEKLRNCEIEKKVQEIMQEIKAKKAKAKSTTKSKSSSSRRKAS